jgi:hypothetical protein
LLVKPTQDKRLASKGPPHLHIGLEGLDQGPQGIRRQGEVEIGYKRYGASIGSWCAPTWSWFGCRKETMYGGIWKALEFV